MKRTPVLASKAEPRCYSLSHDTSSRVCRACPLQEACSTACSRWRQIPTLAQLLARAELATQTPTLDRVEIERIYDCEYLKHFGRRPRRTRSTRNDTMFGRLRTYFLKEDIDPVTFIAANMLAMREFVAGLPYGFQPNMLMGERARARYNAFIRRANRRYHRAASDTADVSTPLGDLRVELAVCEGDVGDMFVRSRWCGSPVTWSEASEAVDVTDRWRSVCARAGSDYAALTRWLSVDGVAREHRLAQLRGAVRVVEGFRSGLSEQIGVRQFSWSALSDVLVRLFDRPLRETPVLHGVGGDLWRLS